MNTIIVRPLITEKSMSDVVKGKYSFVVSKDARKEVIKSVLKQQFNVTVVSISTSTVKGRTKRVGVRRQEVPTADWKKATVTLKKGDKIALFEPGGGEEGKKKEKK